MRKNRSDLIDEMLVALINLRKKQTFRDGNDFVLDGLGLIGDMENHLETLSNVYSSLYLTYRKDRDRRLTSKEQLNEIKGEISNYENEEIARIFKHLLKLTTKIFAGLINPYDQENLEDLNDLNIKIVDQGNPMTIKRILSELESYDY